MRQLSSLIHMSRRAANGEAVDIAATSALGMAMAEAMLPSRIRRRLAGADPYGLIVLVPSTQHVEIVADAIERLLPEQEEVSTLLGEPTLFAANALVDALAQRRHAVAVTTTIDCVPASFKALADDIVTFRLHDLPIVRRTVRQVLGVRASFPKGFLVHPNPEVLCRCIVPGLASTKVVMALARLGETTRNRSGEILPHMRECVEFGNAREWALAVMNDIDAWRAGELSPTELDTACLLVSPPGHGKTRFARTLADSMGAPLIEITAGSVFTGAGHLGDVLSSIRGQFAAASEAAPAVLLLDELDSFSRRDMPDKNRMFISSMVNELLTQLDGASARRPGLVVIGATNFLDAIDPAIRRQGRLSKTLELPIPDEAGVEHILRVHLGGELAEENLDEVVRLATGATPAALMGMVRSAKQSARFAKRALLLPDLLDQLSANHQEDQGLLNRVALHEAGHAIACLLLPNGPQLRRLSLLGSDGSHGHVVTAKLPGANTRPAIEGRIMMLLAGRAAEALIHGENDLSDGAAEDLRMATRLAAMMRAQFGMMGELAHYGSLEQRMLQDAAFAEAIENELRRLNDHIAQALAGCRLHLVALAAELVEKRVLTSGEALRITQAVEDERAAEIEPLEPRAGQLPTFP
tara:strand:- start:2225 stop:4141 length:1917 start_codon:yes stop_codon:yes gene_type:complete